MNIAVCPSHDFPIPDIGAQNYSGVARLVHRHVSSDAGHALQVLGHAIDYLVKEGEADGTITDPTNGRTKAVCLLMALNRQIYLACPEVPTLAQRWLSFLRTHGI